MPGAYLWAWDETNDKYIKVLVDDTGRLLTVASIDELDDIGDVYVPTPTDEYFLYWDAPNARWACRALVDADIPAAIARDTEVTTAISTHTAIAAAHHAVFTTTEHTAIGNGAPHHAEAHTLASHSTKAHSELTGVGTSDHHVRYADSEALAAAVQAGAITDAVTKAPTHDAVYDVKATADAAIAKALLTERGSVIYRNATIPAELLHGTAGQVLQSGGHGADPSWLTPTSNVITITFIIDGGGSAITTGQKGHLEIPFACTLTAWTLAADVAGAIVIDVWKDTYANFPPTDADAMPGAGKEPTIAATNQKAQDTDISDWTTVAIAAGDILAFNVDSCTTITRVTLSLKATKT